jgi:hypothetical protein
MSEKALHNLIIFVLLVAVVLLAMVASKSEHFGVSTEPVAQKGLSARLRRGEGAIGLLSGRLRGMNAINSLPARLRGGSPITGGDAGAGGLKAQIKLPTLEHFRGVGGPAAATTLAARLRTASNGAMGSASATAVSDISGHDSTATKMAIVPEFSKMTIMSNLTTK